MGRPVSDLLPIENRVAVVIVNYRTPDLAKRCLEALEQERSSFRHLKAMLVDGGSADNSADELSSLVAHPRFSNWVEFVALPVNGGFGWANNQAILRLMRRSDAPDYIHLLNPDAEVAAGAVSLLARYLNDHPTTGAVGSQLIEPDGSWSGSAFVFPSIGSEFARGARTQLLERLLRIRPIAIETEEPTEVDWVTGASVMFRVAALKEAGLFDEGFFLYHEEVELMWRLRKSGWSIATEPRSRVRHVGGAATGVTGRPTVSRQPAYLYRSRARFFALTRGSTTAALASAAWMAGYGVFRLRRLLGLAPRSGQVEHQLPDHLRGAFPRKHDSVPARVSLDAEPSSAPAWMKNGWL